MRSKPAPASGGTGSLVQRLRLACQHVGLAYRDGGRLQAGPNVHRDSSRWSCLWGAILDASQHRWWRLSIVTVLPGYLVTHFIREFQGWPRDALTYAWMLVMTALWVDIAVSYRRQRRPLRVAASESSGK
jgi:hypothetical protein